MPLHTLTQDELRSYCKSAIEALEYWLRRLIDQRLSATHGENFLNALDEHGDNLIKKETRESIVARYQGATDRYSRQIDAALLDDTIGIICKQRLFEQYFREPLQAAFPDGHHEARTFLRRLVEPRNRLYHANTISVRQAEQVICYSNDVINSIKLFYLNNSMSQDYNVPTIIKVEDSFGHSVHDGGIKRNNTGAGLIDFRDDSRSDLRPGDTLSIEVEIDPSFDQSEYDVSWIVGGVIPTHAPLRSNKIIIDIDQSHVTNSFDIFCNVKSKLDWHRFGDYDDSVVFIYRVLPPV